jgi:hypothetical protein
MIGTSIKTGALCGIASLSVHVPQLLPARLARGDFSWWYRRRIALFRPRIDTDMMNLDGGTTRFNLGFGLPESQFMTASNESGLRVHGSSHL